MESFSSPLHKNRSWDDDIGLFGLKIDWNIVRAFLKEAASTDSRQDLLYSGGNDEHDVAVFFVVLMFFVFNSYFDQIRLKVQDCLLPKHIIDQQFNSQ